MFANAALYLATIVIWGTTWFAIHFQVASTVPQIWSIFYRFGLAAALFFLICLVTRRPLKMGRDAHIRAVALGAFLFSGNYWFVYASANYIPTGLIAVVFGAITLFNIFFGRIFLGNPIRGRSILAALIGLTGMLLCFLSEIRSLSLDDAAFRGFVLSLFGAALASLGNTASASKSLKEVPIFVTNSFGMLYGTIFLGIAGLLSGTVPSFDTTPSYVITLVYLSVFGTVIAFSAYLTLIRRIGLDKAAYSSVVYPVVALVVSTFYEGYLPTTLTAAGIALVLAGNVMVLRGKRA